MGGGVYAMERRVLNLTVERLEGACGANLWSKPGLGQGGNRKERRADGSSAVASLGAPRATF